MYALIVAIKVIDINVAFMEPAEALADYRSGRRWHAAQHRTGAALFIFVHPTRATAPAQNQ